MSESDRILLEAEAAAAEAKAKHLRACLLDGGVTTAPASPTVPRKKPTARRPTMPRIMPGEAERFGKLNDLDAKRLIADAERKGMIRR